LADVTQLRFAQLLKRAFGVKAMDPGRVLSPIVTASHEIADTYQPENRASRGEKLFGMTNQYTNAVGGFGIAVFVNPTGSGRIAVMKRVTWSLNLPTAATQPGAIAFSIGIPQVAGATVPLIFGQVKDSRFAILTGTVTAVASGLQTSTTGVSGFLNTTLYAVQVFPGAATVPTYHQVDNLDIIVPPGWLNAILFRGDTLPTGTYTWTVCVEGYERTADPNELLVPGV